MIPSSTHRVLRPVLAALVLLASRAVVVAAAEAEPETLVVFTRPDASPLAMDFEFLDLPEIQAMAERLGVPVRVVDVTVAGAPAEVTLTPLIVFQNHRGRSIYQGRYGTLDRLETMIRTARVVPQTSDGIRRTDLPVWTSGRNRLGAVIKLTELGGERPDDFDAAAFAAAARSGIQAGLSRFTAQAEVVLGRSDRVFYVDFHPYRDPRGRLYVSTALFSPFHCHEPLFVSEAPAQGAWSDAADVFRDAAARLETEIVETLAGSAIGDGFDPVPTRVPVVAWDALGLALPNPPERGAGVDVAGIELGRSWRVAPPAPETPPAVLFNFAPPLDYYTGLAPLTDGALTLGASSIGAGATGFFEVDVARVTMGEPDLDAMIRGKGYLEAGEHPRARFVLERLETEATELVFGRLANGTMTGTFTMRGLDRPLTVAASLEPTIGLDGRPRLQLVATWSLRLREPFGMEGPDGPDPARDTLSFRVATDLVPVDETGK